MNKNAQDNGDHEVHVSSCSHLPDKDNRLYLGDFSNCSDAVQKTKDYYDQVNGCYWCSEDCHTS